MALAAVPVFLSYAAADAPLVAELLRHLRPLAAHGVQVYPDDADRPGAAVSRLQRLHGAALILLLASPAALDDADCQSEWQLALHRRAAGEAVVIPVRLRACYAPPSEPWTTLSALPADGTPIAESSHRDQPLSEVAAALHQQAQQLQDLAPAAAAPPPPAGPLLPPQAAYDPAWYVPRPHLEALARDGLTYPGNAVLLFGPERSGKTWLLRHLLRATATPRDRVVSLSLDHFEPACFHSLAAFLNELGRQIGAGLGLLAADVQAAMGADGTPMSNLDRLLRRHLPRLLSEGSDGRMILAIDRADAALAAGLRDPFFGLLRGWADDADEPFSRLRMVLCVSTAPALLVRGVHLSPFNVSDAIALDDLDAAQVQALLVQHHLTWSEAERAAARRLLGGHPYLLRVLMYNARRQGRPVDALLDDPAVFAPYLERYRRTLLREPALQHALRAAYLDQPIPQDSDEAQDNIGRLIAAGLLKGPPDAPRPRCQLYQRLLPR